MVKNLPEMVGKISWSRKCQPTPVFLPGESQRRRSLADYTPWGDKEWDMTELPSTTQHSFKDCELPGSAVARNPPAKAGAAGEVSLIPGLGRFPWRAPVFLPGKFHGQRRLVGYNPRGRKELDTTEYIQRLQNFQVYESRNFFIVYDSLT